MIRTAAVCLILPVVLAAQPPKRAHHALIYDPVAERVLLAGGSSPRAGGECCDMFNDLWSFDGSRWTELGESGIRVSGVGLAFDTRRNRLFSFGGYSPGAPGGPSIGDVRVLENNAWRTIGAHPELRTAEPGFVYDSRRDRFVAFGGSGAQRSVNGDTWEYDGTTWTKLDIAGPPARLGHAMVYDSRRGRTVVIGGMGAAPQGEQPPRYDDVWEFDGRAWTKVETTGGPGPRLAAGVTFDSRRGVVILFGGLSGGASLGDTWSWDGTTWRKLAETGPVGRSMGYLAYDARRDRVVLFGGRKGWPDDLNDTWEWDGAQWRQVGVP